MTALLVAIGAAAGATARWWVSNAVQRRTLSGFPWGTALVNVVGSFLLGVLLGIDAFVGGWTALLALLGTGFCGAFTTFSTFAVETFHLLEEGSYRHAVAYPMGSVLVGLLAAFLGWATVDVLV